MRLVNASLSLSLSHRHQRGRQLRGDPGDEGDPDGLRQGGVAPAGHLPLLLRDGRGVLPLRRADLRHEVRQLDLRRIPGEPNQQRTLNKLPTELRCRNFVVKHRLSMQIGGQACKRRVRNVYACQPSFHFAYHRWWLGGL